MADCKHEQLLSSVDIVPIGGTHYRRATLQISCPACGRRFKFRGESILREQGHALLVPIEEGSSRVIAGGITLPVGAARN